MKIQLCADDYFHDPHFPLKILERNPELPYPLHSHNFYELVIIVSGKGYHKTTHNMFPLSCGNVFFIAPSLEHGYEQVENLHLYNILFLDSIFSPARDDLRNMSAFHAMLHVEPATRTIPHAPELLRLTPGQLAHILSLVKSIRTECDSLHKDMGSHSLAQAQFLQLVITLFRIWSESPRNDNNTVLRLAKALTYIESHLDSSISTEELQEITHMSSSTLNRHFNIATGLSPVAYHVQRRIERACDLITSTHLSVGEIAQTCGFSDANYFSRQFRKIMDLTPIQYRKKTQL